MLVRYALPKDAGEGVVQRLNNRRLASKEGQQVPINQVGVRFGHTV